ncbi:MurR/RpiR family transcriptional regulator [Rhodococcus sp. NPDC059968]|uniref:MurR/RpiR family transcriptional regulator n=1 Tax=Rhodococcus sp. NPDC059968 TaxID=3347017 RepID=UPI00366D6B72
MTMTKQVLVGGEFVTRARAAMSGLGETDKRVLETILQDPEAVVRASATELAAQAGTAQSSAVRACQRIGYRGFQDVKLAIARDLARQQDTDVNLSHDERIDEATPPTEILDRILRRSGHALLDATRTVDGKHFAQTVERFSTATKILVIGNGTSVAPAHDAAYRLSVLGLTASAPADVMTQHLAARQLDASCACLVISNTGATRETLTAAEAAKQAGAFVAAITSYSNSALTRIADAPLVAGGPEYGFRLAAMSSRLAHLGVVDAIFVGIAARSPQPAENALDLMADVTAEHSL